MRRVKINAEAAAALQEQKQAFLDKFGYEPGPNDPVFFDPDKDEPTPLTEAQIQTMTRKIAEKAGLDPDRVERLLLHREDE